MVIYISDLKNGGTKTNMQGDIAYLIVPPLYIYRRWDLNPHTIARKRF